MSEWIESHTALPRNRKFKRLVRLIAPGQIALVIGYLNALWYHTAECAPGGFLAGYTPEDVADACYYMGDDAEEFTAALVDCRWLEKAPDGYAVHDWNEYNRQHRERQNAARRQAEKRARERDSEATSPERHGDVTETSRTTDRQTDGTDRQTGQTRVRASTNPLVELAREIPGWKPSTRDEETVAAGVARLGEAKARDVIAKLHTKQAATGKYRNLRTTLANWFNTENLPEPEQPPPKAEPQSPFANEQERELYREMCRQQEERDKQAGITDGC